MDKCREAFEKKFPIPAHWIEFDEKRNKYYCPYVADAKASECQEMWEVWQSRQAEVDALNDNHLAYIDKVIAMESDYLKQIEEKDKRIKQALSELESLHNKKWAEWKEQADMHSQGEANAYEHAMQILEKVLRGEHEA